MDPDACLAEIRAVAALVNDGADDNTDAAIRLAELVGALDEWISSGGFLPAAWRGGK
jgi:hypothetical protein